MNLSKATALLLLLTLYSSFSFSQNYFGSNPVLEEIYKANPELRAADEKEREHLLSEFKKYRPQTKSDGFTIPVVVHIISHPSIPESNISDAQVYQAIQETNLRLKGEHPESADVIPEFQPIMGSADIQLKLATRDPNGDCTNGIIRYSQIFEDNAGDRAITESRKWDQSKYFNIFVVLRIASGAAVYSFNPGPSINGNPRPLHLVINYQYFGSTGTSNSKHSFLFTQKIANSLGLSHIWGNTNSPGEQENCSRDDGLEDTPNCTGNPDFSFTDNCDLGRTTCGTLDNVQNFMDYGSCQIMFTKDQCDFMQFTLLQENYNIHSLWQPENLIATGTDYDSLATDYLCKADFNTIGSRHWTGIPIGLLDKSYYAVDTWEWNFPGAMMESDTVQNPTVIYNNPGVYNISLTAGYQSQEDSHTQSIQVFESPFFAPFIERFDNNHIDSLMFFEKRSLVGDQGWQSSDIGFDDDKSIYINAFQKTVSDSGLTDELISGPINISNLTEPTVGFEYAYANNGEKTVGSTLVLSCSYDYGRSFIPLDTLWGEELVTAEVSDSEEFIPSNSDWKTNINEITLDDTVEYVMLKLDFTHINGNNIFVDNFRVKDFSTINIGEFKKKDITLFPNPTSDILYFRGQHVTTISVLSLHGKHLTTEQNESGLNQVDLSAFQPGIYFIELEGDFGLARKKILKL